MLYLGEDVHYNHENINTLKKDMGFIGKNAPPEFQTKYLGKRI